MTAAEHLEFQTLAKLALGSLQKSSWIYGIARLVVFVVMFIAAAQLAGGGGLLAVVILALSTLVFLGLTLRHLALDERAQAQRYLIDYHQQGIDRIAGNWQHEQADGSEYVKQWHPYAHDLDLIGPHGFYALLNTTGSAAGRACLADFLFHDEHVADADAIHSIQQLAQQTKRRAAWSSALRQESRLWSADEEAKSHAAYLEWLQSRPAKSLPNLVIYAVRILLMLAVASGFVIFGWSWLWTGCIALAIVASLLNDRATHAWQHIPLDHVHRLLRSWHRALDSMNAEEAAAACFSANLQTQIEQLQQHIGQQLRFWHGLTLRSNPFWRYGIGALLLADWHYVRGLDRWREAHGVQLYPLISVFGEIDVLHAFATYAAEQGGSWAKIVSKSSSDTPLLFAADDLAHPLLAADKRIGNSIRLDVGQVLLLTGANASGKSTFLRSIAFAILMSRMGLPVRASHCELQAQRLATVMRIQDALWQGMSRFQAEVKQLKAVLDRSQSLGNPVVLILDEILAGTNSEERRRGSLAFIRHLSDYQGLILITTHDLALAEIAITEPQRICCYHFADRAEIAAESADVLFDYKLRPGVLQSTNALQVMQAAGLPIE